MTSNHMLPAIYHIFLQLGLLLLTDILTIFTPGMEPATGGYVHGAGHITFQKDSFLLIVNISHRDC